MRPWPELLGDPRFDEPAAFFEMRPFFEESLRDLRWLAERINEHLALLVADPSEGLGSYARGDAWQLEDEVNGALQLIKIDPDLPELPWLSDDPFHRMTACLGPGPVTFRSFRRGEGDPSVLDPSVRLVEEAPITLSPGEILEIPARERVVLLMPVPTAVTFLTVESRTLLDQTWYYDRETLAPCLSVAEGGELARIDRCLEYLSHREYRPAADAVESLCIHPSHFVRWSALKTLLVLDEARALPVLRRMLHDVHPHVRRAASATLAQAEAGDA